VEFRNASFAYPTKPKVLVLKHVNLKIRKGESVALVGASGSGKSSIVSLILRFYDLVEGELYIGGRNIKTLDLNYLRRQMGFVAQEPVLFSGSLRENIEYGLEEHRNDEKVMMALEIANANEFVLNEDKFPEKLDTLVGERGIQLSGGQKQRIAIGNYHLIQLEVL
jgi:putative ABC transport system ATP-binding protein